MIHQNPLDLGVGGQILLHYPCLCGLPPWSQTAHLVLGAVCSVWFIGQVGTVVPSGMGKRIVAMGDGLWDLFPDGPRFGGATAIMPAMLLS